VGDGVHVCSEHVCAVFVRRVGGLCAVGSPASIEGGGPRRFAVPKAFGSLFSLSCVLVCLLADGRLLQYLYAVCLIDARQNGRCASFLISHQTIINNFRIGCPSVVVPRLLSELLCG
jgi:hypothetical protein